MIEAATARTNRHARIHMHTYTHTHRHMYTHMHKYTPSHHHATLPPPHHTHTHTTTHTQSLHALEALRPEQLLLSGTGWQVYRRRRDRLLREQALEGLLRNLSCRPGMDTGEQWLGGPNPVLNRIGTTGLPTNNSIQIFKNALRPGI